ncbi:hypothetical protein GPECTOR_31g321 [Gonium pectorale]|uniref:Uncharacterized protein n=1 Tax=Gonium pectorale TaxID=33097 RepID=A0A150GDQ0_GONPE|nr:hypothetical protein GPECTOR_31g321 [Gonium pectorale]|eukprot:KXZ47959.1 hypothetical protein GPECTOR_31g321 [Gonium pectorale]
MGHVAALECGTRLLDSLRCVPFTRALAAALAALFPNLRSLSLLGRWCWGDAATGSGCLAGSLAGDGSGDGDVGGAGALRGWPSEAAACVAALSPLTSLVRLELHAAMLPSDLTDGSGASSAAAPEPDAAAAADPALEPLRRLREIVCALGPEHYAPVALDPPIAPDPLTRTCPVTSSSSGGGGARHAPLRAAALADGSDVVQRPTRGSGGGPAAASGWPRCAASPAPSNSGSDTDGGHGCGSNISVSAGNAGSEDGHGGSPCGFPDDSASLCARRLAALRRGLPCLLAHLPGLQRLTIVGGREPTPAGGPPYKDVLVRQLLYDLLASLPRLQLPVLRLRACPILLEVGPLRFPLPEIELLAPSQPQRQRQQGLGQQRQLRDGAEGGWGGGDAAQLQGIANGAGLWSDGALGYSGGNDGGGGGGDGSIYGCGGGCSYEVVVCDRGGAELEPSGGAQSGRSATAGGGPRAEVPCGGAVRRRRLVRAS